MEVNFLGLAMSRKQRLILIIAIPAAILSIVLFLVGSVVSTVQTVEEVGLPSGQLSDSIFELQNMSYTALNGTNSRYSFARMPFVMDIVGGETAKVEGADIVYYAPYYFYYNVFPKEEAVEELLLSQLTSVLAPNYAGEGSIKVVCMEEGNLNGCYGSYTLYEVSIPDVTVQYMVLYRLHVSESIYESEYDMLIGCMTEGYDTQTLSTIQSLAHGFIGTLRYDKERAEQLLKAREVK